MSVYRTNGPLVNSLIFFSFSLSFYLSFQYDAFSPSVVSKHAFADLCEEQRSRITFKNAQSNQYIFPFAAHADLHLCCALTRLCLRKPGG